MPEFQPFKNSGCPTCRGMHKEMILGKTGGHSIINDHAIFTTHQTVTTLSNGQLHPCIGIYAIQEFSRIRTLYIDLTQSRCIEDAKAVPNRQTFPIDGFMHQLPIPREIPGAPPLSDILELSALGLMPRLNRCIANRVKQCSSISSRYGTKGNGCVVGPKHGCADFRDMTILSGSSNRCAINTAQFTLICTKTHRCISLYVLNTFITFERSNVDIRSCDIQLQINELFRCTTDRFGMRHKEEVV